MENICHEISGIYFDVLPSAIFPSNLVKLRIIGNVITHLNEDIFAELGSLESLIVEDNKSITLLHRNLLKNNVHLKDVSFRGNQIRIIGKNVFRNLIRLESLNLSKNLITKINRKMMKISKNNCLKSLDLSNNQISFIKPNSFIAFGSLCDLKLGSNLLKKVPKNLFLANSELRMLFLDDNYLKEIPKDLLKKVENLRFLNLNGNLIENFHNDVFQTNHKLSSLFLSENYIENLPNCLNNLEKFSIENNKIKISSAILFQMSQFRNLTHINMNSNMLPDNMEPNFFENFPSLQLLEMKNIQNGPHFINLQSNFKMVSLNLENFQLNLNKFDNFNSLLNLTFLNLSGNKLHYLNNHFLRKLQNLEILLLSQCNITFIFEKCLNNLRKLTHLDVSFNEFSVIPGQFLEFNVDLTDLIIVNLPITYLTESLFCSLINLKKLKLGRMYDLKILNPNLFQNLVNLKILCISHTKIHDLNNLFLTLKQLNCLYLDNNCIEKLAPFSFKFNENLKTLSLESNLIEDLTETDFESLRLLKILKLHSNHLIRISEILFSKNLLLEYLDLSMNYLTFIANDCFKQLKMLKYLNLSCNLIENQIGYDFFSGNHNLETLNFNSALLKNQEIDTVIANLIILKVLDLSLCKISDFLHIFSNLINLTDLTICYNHDLVEINVDIFQNLVELQILKLSHNSIRTLDANCFADLRKLTHLDLSYNELSAIVSPVLRNCQQLEFVELSRNQIEVVCSNLFENLPCLKLLNLSYNFLKMIPADIFRNTNNLERLLLVSNNEIRELTKDLFCNCHKLKLLLVNMDVQLPDKWLISKRVTVCHDLDAFMTKL